MSGDPSNVSVRFAVLILSYNFYHARYATTLASVVIEITLSRKVGDVADTAEVFDLYLRWLVLLLYLEIGILCSSIRTSE